MPGTTSNADACDVDEVTEEQGRDILDRAAKDALGIPGDEFLARFDRGYYDDSDDPAVAGVAMLIPFAR
jgi:hypothetical protein